MDDSFSNVEVKNGKVSQNGDSNVVIGYALPGIKESLNVKDSDFIDDLELPEDFEVTADVKDFKAGYGNDDRGKCRKHDFHEERGFFFSG